MLALRKKIKPLAEAGRLPNITLNDMVSYALIRALLQHPEINGQFLDDIVRIFNRVHLGFAVDTERGLLVPVVRDASLLTLGGLSTRMKELASACQTGSINPDLLSAEQASFTITNLGAFGIEYFTPVLNLPQMGILGVNTITPRPAQLDDGTFGFIPKIGLSLTYDHRAIDGAPASRFLQTLCSEIENFSPEIEGLDS
jgi:pyruvate dehydrogenase E2 component (dihydrolipoamide acetyltransferase)